jgi:hypothetical protein
MRKGLPQHLQNHGIVIDQQDLNIARHETYFFRRLFDLRW